jgi:hypothetical protein
VDNRHGARLTRPGRGRGGPVKRDQHRAFCPEGLRETVSRRPSEQGRETLGAGFDDSHGGLQVSGAAALALPCHARTYHPAACRARALRQILGAGRLCGGPVAHARVLQCAHVLFGDVGQSSAQEEGQQPGFAAGARQAAGAGARSLPSTLDHNSWLHCVSCIEHACGHRPRDPGSLATGLSVTCGIALLAPSPTCRPPHATPSSGVADES